MVALLAQFNWVLYIVNEVHQLAEAQEDNWEVSQKKNQENNETRQQSRNGAIYCKNEGRGRAPEERERKQAIHSAFAEKLIQRALGGAQMPHQIAKTDPWRGGASLSQTPEDDAAERARIGANFEERYEHWHLSRSQRCVRPRPPSRLQQVQEWMAFTRRCRLIFRMSVVSVFLSFSKRRRCGETWPTNASTTRFFLIPQNTTIERRIALVPTLIRWWKWLRPPRVTECNVTLDACSNFVGGTERTE